MDWSSIASATLGGLGSIFGGLFGKSGQDDANATNLQIARETNEANRNNQEYQNLWNLNMWNEQNRYNTPAAQRQRLEDAGLNPIFYGLDGTGNAGALTSAPFTAVNGAPMSNSGQFLGQGIANASLQAAQVANIQAQTDNIKANTEGTILQNDITNATKGDIISTAHFQMQVTEANVDYIKNNAKEVEHRIQEIDKHVVLMQKQIESITQSMTYEQLRYELDKECREAEIRIKESELDIKEKEYMLSELVASQNFMLGSYNAITNRQNADTNKELFLFNKWCEEQKLPFTLDVLDSQVVVNLESANLNRQRTVTEVGNSVNAASENVYGDFPMFSSFARLYDKLCSYFSDETPRRQQSRENLNTARSDAWRNVREEYHYPRVPYND